MSPPKILQTADKQGKQRMYSAGQLGEYILAHGKTRILDKEELAKQLSAFLGGNKVTEQGLRSTVCMAREYLERTHGKTIWNIRGEGWRMASEDEKAVYLVSCAKRTIRFADRTRRIYEVTDKRLIPGAMKKVFGTTERAQDEIAEYSNKFREFFLKKGQTALEN